MFSKIRKSSLLAMIAILLTTLLPIQVSTSASGTVTPTISVGGAHMLALDSNGEVWAWGENNAGQLGNGSTNSSGTSAKVKNLTGIWKIAAGELHSAAVTNDGKVWTWGHNGKGQLGDGSVNGNAYRSEPYLVQGLTGVNDIAVGGQQTYALRSDGTVWAWGSNASAQLGDGTLVDRSLPVKVKNLTNIIAITAGRDNAFALKSDGTVWGWGKPGTLYKTPNSGERFVSVQIPGLSGIVQIRSGWNHAVALKNDGSLWVWGSNVFGQLGSAPSNQVVTTPKQMLGPSKGAINTITSIAAGANHSLLLRSDGSVWSWGLDDLGQLGNGDTEGTTPLKKVSIEANTGKGMPFPVAIFAGGSSSALLKSDGTVWTWGSNQQQQLGVTAANSSSVPLQIPMLTIGATVIPSQGGSNGSGRGGGSGGGSTGSTSNVVNLLSLSVTLPQPDPLWKQPKTIEYTQFKPTKRVTIDPSKPTTSNPNRVAYSPAFSNNTLNYSATVIHSVSSVWVKPAISSRATATINDKPLDPGNKWGVSVPLQSGMNTIVVRVTSSDGKETKTYQLSVLRAFEPRRGITAGGDSYSLLIDRQNRLVSWGAHTRNTAPQIEKLPGPVKVDMQSSHALVLDAQGSVWGYGSNSHQQLGLVKKLELKPLQKLGFTRMKDIAAGGRHTILLSKDGPLKGIGDNKAGQLSGNLKGSKTPVSEILTGLTAVTAGGSHTLAINKAGWLWGFGANTHGQLGDGTVTGSSFPVLVADLDQVYTAVAGDTHSVALRKDGTVWTWGYNDFGQRGDGATTSNRTKPSMVLTDAVDIAAGKHHTLALKADGTVWFWGSHENSYKKELGLLHRKPVQVKGLTDVVAIGAGSMHSIAVKKDGSVWVWGNNTNGQLGNAAKRSTPVPVQLKM